MTSFVITGFPKCGTSALIRAIESEMGATIGLQDGQLEAPFFVQGQFEAPPAAVIYGHKFTSYTYNLQAMERIGLVTNPPVVVTCTRDPLRSLVSWRQMHLRIASGGYVNPNHFVNRDEATRTFYAEASLTDYYYEFAQTKLEYAKRIKRLLPLIPNNRFVLVDQAAFAAKRSECLSALAVEFGLPDVAERISESASADDAPAPTTHKGFADDASRLAEVDPEVAKELARERRLLNELMDELESTNRARVIR